MFKRVQLSDFIEQTFRFHLQFAHLNASNLTILLYGHEHVSYYYFPISLPPPPPPPSQKISGRRQREHHRWIKAVGGPSHGRERQEQNGRSRIGGRNVPVGLPVGPFSYLCIFCSFSSIFLGD
jgi:hypothetical protein